MDDQVTNLVVKMIQDLKSDVNARFDKVESKIDNLVTKDECKNNSNCKVVDPGETIELLEKKTEFDLKKIAAYTTLILGAIGGITALVKQLFDVL